MSDRYHPSFRFEKYKKEVMIYVIMPDGKKRYLGIVKDWTEQTLMTVKIAFMAGRDSCLNQIGEIKDCSYPDIYWEFVHNCTDKTPVKTPVKG